MGVAEELRPNDLVSLSLMRRAAQDGTARLIRELAGISQDELGRSCGASAAAISRWEAGLRVPRTRGAERYAAALFALLVSLGDVEDDRIADLQRALKQDVAA